jgi:hypothetical protein
MHAKFTGSRQFEYGGTKVLPSRNALAIPSFADGVMLPPQRLVALIVPPILPNSNLGPPALVPKTARYLSPVLAQRPAYSMGVGQNAERWRIDERGGF